VIILWAIGGYLAVLIVISLVKSRKVADQDDFMVAGRGVPALFLVGTLVCTWIGSGSLFGGAGRAFALLARLGPDSFPLGLFELPLTYDYIIYPAATASIVALVAVSLATKPSDEAKWRPFWAPADAA
jgi:Na+/proline symporter